MGGIQRQLGEHIDNDSFVNWSPANLYLQHHNLCNLTIHVQNLFKKFKVLSILQQTPHIRRLRIPMESMQRIPPPEVCVAFQLWCPELTVLALVSCAADTVIHGNLHDSQHDHVDLSLIAINAWNLPINNQAVGLRNFVFYRPIEYVPPPMKYPSSFKI